MATDMVARVVFRLIALAPGVALMILGTVRHL